MEEKNSFQNFLKRAIRALNKSQITYVLIGGVVVTIHGRPRSTMDIDLIISGDNEQLIINLEECLREEGFNVPPNEIMIAVQEAAHCSIFGHETLFRLDIKAPNSLLERQALLNRLSVTLLGEPTFIQIPEEIIIAKLLYGSDQDWDDAYSILLRLKDQLDYKLLRRLAIQEQVTQELENLLKQLDQE
jgi:hypothetical protein